MKSATIWQELGLKDRSKKGTKFALKCVFQYLSCWEPIARPKFMLGALSQKRCDNLPNFFWASNFIGKKQIILQEWSPNSTMFRPNLTSIQTKKWPNPLFQLQASNWSIMKLNQSNFCQLSVYYRSQRLRAKHRRRDFLICRKNSLTLATFNVWDVASTAIH